MHKIGGLTESDVVFAAKCDAQFTPVIARAG
jgi:pterin-4a-carbinolamine dehydratase